MGGVIDAGVRVSMGDFEDAAEDYYGWCPVCEDFTRDCTEPDAEGYDCPKCQGHEVMGAEQAILLGRICF